MDEVLLLFMYQDLGNRSVNRGIRDNGMAAIGNHDSQACPRLTAYSLNDLNSNEVLAKMDFQRGLGQAFYDRSDPTDPQNAWPRFFARQRVAKTGGGKTME